MLPDFLPCDLFTALGLLEEAATTAQQPCFSTKLAQLLCQKHQAVGKNPRLVYRLPLAADLIPGPPSASAARSAPSTAKQPGEQGANAEGDRGRDGR